MNIATIAFGVIVVLAAWRGYRKGFIGAISRALSLLVAYPAAIVLTKPLADLLVDVTALDGLLVYFIAGMFVFLAAVACVNLLLYLYSKRCAQDEELSSTSRISGACAGFVIGSVLGLLAVYAVSVVRKPDASKLPSALDRLFETTARNLVSLAATAAADLVFNDPTTSRFTQSFVEDPHTMLSHVQGALGSSEQVTALMANEQVTAMVADGDVDGLMQVPEFQELVNDTDIQALLPAAAAPGADAAQATAENMVAVWGKIERVRTDPEFLAIISDPELVRQLQARDMKLMTNPKLNELMEIILAGETPAP